MISVGKPILFSAFERYGSLLFFVVSAAVLARLLSPEEFGICAVVVAFTSVVTGYFQEFGGANYLIQKATLVERNIRTAFTVTLIISSFVALLLVALSGTAARFFGQEGLRIGITISALNFVLSPISVTISALLRRQLAFASLAGCNLATNFIVSLSSIVLAAAGWSFLAPIVAMVIGTVVLTVLLLMYRPEFRIFKPCLEGYREVFAFGAYSSAVVIVNVFYQWSPQLMLGRILDFAAVGLYSRAVSITQIFDKLVLQTLTPVILPAISAHSRAGGDLKAAYLGAIGLLSVLQWPFLLFLAMNADAIILLWLGATWIDVAPLVRVLCIASLSLFAACLTFPVLVAVGRVRDTLVSSLISLPPSIAIIALASFWGVQAVANAALVAFPLQAAVAIWFVARQLAFGPTDLVRATLKSAVVTLCCAAGIILSIAITQSSGSGPALALLLASVLAFAGWWAGLIITDHPLLVRLRVFRDEIAPSTSAGFRRIAGAAFIGSRFDVHKK